MIRVDAFTSGVSVPSARFRIRQHVLPLERLGISVREHVSVPPLSMPLPGPLARIRRRHLLPLALGWTAATAVLRLPPALAGRAADLTWIERHFVPGLNQLASLTRRPRVLDVDDAIWLEGWAGRSAPSLARRVDAVVAGNQFLADWFSRLCPTVHVVPTAVDCERIQPSPPAAKGMVIGWTGTSGNFRYLEEVADPLSRFFDARPGARLLICADRQPDSLSIRRLPMDFVKWSPTAEVSVLHDMHVGIMPIDDSDHSRGKCSFKLLQYMAAGRPFVASPYGMNKDVLGTGRVGLSATTPADWRDALEDLASNEALRVELGQNGRNIAVARYDVRVVAATLARIFTGLAGAPAS